MSVVLFFTALPASLQSASPAASYSGGLPLLLPTCTWPRTVRDFFVSNTSFCAWRAQAAYRDYISAPTPTSVRTDNERFFNAMIFHLFVMILNVLWLLFFCSSHLSDIPQIYGKNTDYGSEPHIIITWNPTVDIHIPPHSCTTKQRCVLPYLCPTEQERVWLTANCAPRLSLPIF